MEEYYGKVAMCIAAWVNWINFEGTNNLNNLEEL